MPSIVYSNNSLQLEIRTLALHSSYLMNDKAQRHEQNARVHFQAFFNKTNQACFWRRSEHHANRKTPSQLEEH